jgi:hypothetical protein
MLRRVLSAVFVSSAVLVSLAAGALSAEAVTIRDLIELSKAGVSDTILLALIEVDRPVFAVDPTTLKQLKEAGLSDTVVVAMIRSGRSPIASEPAAQSAAPITDPGPDVEPADRVIVIDHHDSAPQAPVAYPVPVAVPIYVPSFPWSRLRGRETVTTTVATPDAGLVRIRTQVPPNCTKAQPVYWGFGGKLRPDSWTPPPTIVCR